MAIEHNSFLLLFPLEQDSLLMTVTTLFCFSIVSFVDLDFGLLGSGIVQKLGLCADFWRGISLRGLLYWLLFLLLGYHTHSSLLFCIIFGLRHTGGYTGNRNMNLILVLDVMCR